MKIAIIGTGSMGGAFAKAWASSGHELVLYNRSRDKAEQLAKELEEAQVVPSLSEALSEVAVVLFAVKPKDVVHLSRECSGLKWQGPSPTIFSVLAGVSLRALQELFPWGGSFFRSMPSLSIAYKRGVIAVTTSDPPPESMKKLLSLLGECFWVEEGLMNSMTALVGSAPAYFCTLIEAFMQGGIELGVPAEQALNLALCAAEGAIAIIRKQGVHPAVVHAQIASPGGTTIAGQRFLEEYKIRAAISAALRGAKERAEEMGYSSNSLKG